MKKSERIPVNVTPSKKTEIEKWANSEGLSVSAYLLNLHNGNVRYAHEHGLPLPRTSDFGPLED